MYIVGTLVHHLGISVFDELDRCVDYSIRQNFLILNFPGHFTNVNFRHADHFSVNQSIPKQNSAFKLLIENCFQKIKMT